MKTSTRRIIKLLLESDDTISIQHQQDIWEVVTNRPRVDETPPLLLTQTQAADLLGVARQTVRNIVIRGKLKPVSVLDSKRYRRKDIERIAMEGTK